MLRASEVHQLVNGLESSMQAGTTQFAQQVYEHVEKEVARLDNGLNALGGDIQSFNRNQITEGHLQNFATSGQVQAVDARVTDLESAYRSYVDQAVTTARTRLLAEISGRVVMVKADFQRQFNELKTSIGATLQEVKAQVAEVQKSQDKMWGAIDRMGEELWGASKWRRQLNV